MAAEIIELCDQVVATIKAEWEPESPDSIERVYEAPVTVDDPPSLVGRKVYVFPMRKLFDGAPDRGTRAILWTVGILAVERCEEAGGPSRDWMDERAAWQEAFIETPINFEGRDDDDYLSFSGRDLLTQSLETDIYDVDYMAEKKLFWSETEAVFTEFVEV